MNQPRRTPPIPHTIVSQIGMLSLSPGATNFPSRPMMMPATMTPMISMLGSLPQEPRPRSRPCSVLSWYPRGDLLFSVAKTSRQPASALTPGRWDRMELPLTRGALILGVLATAVRELRKDVARCFENLISLFVTDVTIDPSLRGLRDQVLHGLASLGQFAGFDRRVDLVEPPRQF